MIKFYVLIRKIHVASYLQKPIVDLIFYLAEPTCRKVEPTQLYLH